MINYTQRTNILKQFLNNSPVQYVMTFCKIHSCVKNIVYKHVQHTANIIHMNVIYCHSWNLIDLQCPWWSI